MPHYLAFDRVSARSPDFGWIRLQMRVSPLSSPDNDVGGGSQRRGPGDVSGRVTEGFGVAAHGC